MDGRITYNRVKGWQFIKVIRTALKGKSMLIFFGWTWYAFAQFGMGVSQINVHQHRFSPTARNVACPFCIEEKETEMHFLLECPVYVFLRHKYLPDKASAHGTKSHFLSLMNSISQHTIFNVGKFLVCAFNLSTSKMEVPS